MVEHAHANNLRNHLPIVELQTAYHWFCEQCGEDNFALPQKYDFVDDTEREQMYREYNELEDWEMLPADWRDFEVVAIPDVVTCKRCGANFATRDERTDNDGVT
jgi:ribosomal protein L37E